MTVVVPTFCKVRTITRRLAGTAEMRMALQKSSPGGDNLLMTRWVVRKHSPGCGGHRLVFKEEVPVRADEFRNCMVTIADKKLVCSHCGGERFDSKIFFLEPNLFFFRDSPWTQEAVRLFGCVGCARLEQFIANVDMKVFADEEEIAAAEKESEGTCPECGLALDDDIKDCPACKAEVKR